MINLFLPLLLLAAQADVPTRADPVLHTLMAGDLAQERGDHAGLLDSVQMLKALGATPAQGQDDLAVLWTQEAQGHGVTLSSDLAFRGRALGPAYRRGALGARGSVTVRQLFLAGQRAQISIAPGRGASQLSVRVQGADGNTLCAKAVSGVQVDCIWLPLFTDRYDIVIENGGPTAAAFYLVVR